MERLPYTAVELSEQIRKKQLSVREAVEAVFKRIDGGEKDWNSFISLCRQEAFAQAEKVQKEIDEGKLLSPLAGVPVAVKDNLCTGNRRTTCASKMLAKFVPHYSATAVERLEQAGAVIIGKTNMDEFAMGSTTETSFAGPVKNPWNKKHVPGGSSGGSAAAVAAGESVFALGTDTGGSIRQPAGYCGVVGLKPTYSTVSRYGLIAYASSFDQIGPICQDVRDCAAVLNVIAAYDKRDATSLKRKPEDYREALYGDIRGMRIGLPREYFAMGLEREVKDAVLAAAGKLQEMGAVIEEISLPLTEYAIPSYYTIASAEASSNLARYDGVKYGYRTKEMTDLQEMYKRTRSEGFGTEVKRRIMWGTFVLSEGYYEAYYQKALKIRALIKREFDEVFKNTDVILGPVAPQTAPELGESLKDPLKMMLGDIYTISANLAGLPAICVPCGKDRKGLPIGLQLMGDCFMEKKILQVAYAYEQARGDFGMPDIEMKGMG